MVNILISLVLFFVAALFEIGGGYLVWKWLRERKGVLFAFLGAIVLFIYGIIQTFQPANFGRVYAAYGGVFIVSSLIWGYVVEKRKADKYDIIGAVIALIGVIVIMYWPR